MKADTLRDIEARALAVPADVSITTVADPAEHTVAVAKFLSYARTDVPRLVEEIRRLKRLVAQYEESASMACEEPPPGCSCAGCSYARDRSGSLTDEGLLVP